MREFYLINGKGNTYSLTDKLHWLYEPENLGAKFNSKYEQIGSNFIRTQRIARPDDISGKILFTGGNPYSDYHNFIKFIAAEPLILEYFNNNDRFRAKVDLKEIKKAEKAGREWEDEYLRKAFEEADALIDTARERKGFK